MLAARAAGLAQRMTNTADAAASDITRRPPMRSRATIKAKFINALMPDIWELPGTLTRRLRQMPEAAAQVRGVRLTFPSAVVGSMRGQRRRAGLGMDLGRHHALGPRPEAHQHILARTQLGHAEAAQRFHMHENVRRTLATGQEAETAQPVEPLDLGPLQPTGRRDADMGPGWKHLRRMDRGGLIHRNDPERLIALGALHALDHQPRAFIGGLIAVAPKHRDVQQHIRRAIVRNDEAISLGSIEPFDDAGYFDKVGCGIAEPRQCIHRRIALRSGCVFTWSKSVLPCPA